MNPYIKDILSQPEALHKAVKKYSTSTLKNLDLADFDRIIISGMGSSCYAAYPALIELSKQSTPVQLVNAAELLHSLHGMIGAAFPALAELAVRAQRGAGELAGTNQAAASRSIADIRQRCVESTGRTRRPMYTHSRRGGGDGQHEDLREHAGRQFAGSDSARWWQSANNDTANARYGGCHGKISFELGSACAGTGFQARKIRSAFPPRARHVDERGLEWIAHQQGSREIRLRRDARGGLPSWSAWRSCRRGSRR